MRGVWAYFPHGGNIQWALSKGSLFMKEMWGMAGGVFEISQNNVNHEKSEVRISLFNNHIIYNGNKHQMISYKYGLGNSLPVLINKFL